MKAYKLTDHLGQTKNQTQWGENISHTAFGGGGQPLCYDGWIHFYTNPLLAILMNPVHAHFSKWLSGEDRTKESAADAARAADAADAAYADDYADDAKINFVEIAEKAMNWK